VRLKWGEAEISFDPFHKLFSVCHNTFANFVLEVCIILQNDTNLQV